MGMSEPGTAEAKVTYQHTYEDGTTHFTLWGTAQNGFAAAEYPLAPGGTIDFNLNFVVAPDGKVSVDLATSTTKEYPTYEAYSYQVNQWGEIKVTELFVRPEKDVDALKRPQTPINKKDQ